MTSSGDSRNPGEGTAFLRCTVAKKLDAICTAFDEMSEGVMVKIFRRVSRDEVGKITGSDMAARIEWPGANGVPMVSKLEASNARILLLDIARRLP